jgi:hypothetical protein
VNKELNRAAYDKVDQVVRKHAGGLHELQQTGVAAVNVFEQVVFNFGLA